MTINSVFSNCFNSNTTLPLSEPWKKQYLDELKTHLLTPYNKENRWNHLVLTWQELTANQQVLTHKYALTIDTKKWNFYLDHSMMEIFKRCVAHTVIRPLFTFIKTIYHLSIVYPIYNEIEKTRAGIQTEQTCKENIVKSLADIVRTPLFGLAMTITSIAMLCIMPFSTDLTNHGRLLLGKFEQMSEWGELRSNWTLFGCFQPFDVTTFYTYLYKKAENTADHSENTLDEPADTIYVNNNPDDYDKPHYLLERQMSNFCRKQIRYKRKVADPFNFNKKLNPNIAYCSQILTKTKKTV